MLPQGGLVFYLDEQALLLIANFALDYLLLWASAATTRNAASWPRLLSGALIGTVYYVLYVLSVFRFLPFYGLLGSPITVVAVSFAMLAAAFAPISCGRFRSVVSHFYIIAFISAGSGMAGAYLFGSSGYASPLAGVMIAIATLLLVAELGWGVLQRRSWRQGQQFLLDIHFGEHTARVTALLDTGNQLRDPISGAPVVVVEHRALAKLLPPQLARALKQLETGDLWKVSCIAADTGWSARFRIIPFNSVGTANGLMVGFRPDAVTLWLTGSPHYLRGCVVALSPRPLDTGRMYQALIGPDLVENATAVRACGANANHADADRPGGHLRPGDHLKPGDHLRPGGHLRKEEMSHAVTHG